MKGWSKVFETQILHRAEIVRALLDEAGIEAVIVNKKDSMYNLGFFEVYVKADHVLKTIKLINDEICFE
jgi:Zn-dependent membrane protease YugP